MTPLHWAAKHGPSGVVKELLAYANSAVSTADGRTALHWAASRGHTCIVEMLLADGRVHADNRSRNGWTALHWAACSGNRAIVGHGVNPRVEAILCSTEVPDQPVLLNGGDSKGHEEVVGMLLDAGLDPNTQTNDGHSPLHWAAASGNIAIVDSRLQHGAKKEIHDNEGRTPWDYASSNSAQAQSLTRWPGAKLVRNSHRLR
jgi:ankyrin repeat protein